MHHDTITGTSTQVVTDYQSEVLSRVFGSNVDTVMEFAQERWGLECEDESFIYHNYSTTVMPVLSPRNPRLEKD